MDQEEWHYNSKPSMIIIRFTRGGDDCPPPRDLVAPLTQCTRNSGRHHGLRLRGELGPRAGRRLPVSWWPVPRVRI